MTEKDATEALRRIQVPESIQAMLSVLGGVSLGMTAEELCLDTEDKGTMEALHAILLLEGGILVRRLAGSGGHAHVMGELEQKLIMALETLQQGADDA